MDETNIWAVVPVKSFATAKTRLASAYSARFRHDLARAMAEDVLCALSAAPALGGVIVVTNDTEASRLAQRYRALVWSDGADEGHTGAVMAAADRLAREHRAGLLTVPGDIPCITPDEIRTLLDAHRPGPAFTITPAHDYRGSNAIVMSPCNAIRLSFGDDSFRPHLERARAARFEPDVVPLPGIGLDVDNPVDLAQVLRANPGVYTRACLECYQRDEPGICMVGAA